MKTHSILWVVMAGVCLWQCGSDKVAGTSTTTGNTITGVAMDNNGQPAVNARAVLRTHDHAPDGVLAPTSTRKQAAALRKYGTASSSSDPTAAPASAPGLAPVLAPGSALDTAFTDSAGRYTFEIEEADTFFLEITYNNQVAWDKEVVISGEPGDTSHLENLVLNNTVTLSGDITSEGSATYTLWVGVPGTDHYAKADAQGNYVLTGLATGRHHLQIVRKTAGGGRETFTVEKVTLEESGDYTLEPILLPETDSDPIIDEPVTCPANEDTLPQVNTFNASSPFKMVLRSVLLLDTPVLVNIDLCLGEWSTATLLPGPQPPLGYFAGGGVDYILGGEALLYSRDTAADAWQEHALVNPLAAFDVWQGSFYAYNTGKGTIDVYSGLDALLTGNPTDKITGTFSESLHHFSVTELYVFYLVKGSPPSLVAMLNGTVQGEFRLEALAGAEIAGMKAVDNQVYILTSSGVLFQYDGLTGTEKSRRFLRSEYLWLGLSQF